MPAAFPGREDYRLLVIDGALFAAIAIVGQLVGDGAIELVQPDIDPGTG